MYAIRSYYGMRQAVFKHGSYSDVLYMSVLREEWNAKKKEN